MIGRFFLASLSTERTVEGPPGVILAAPPEVDIEELGELVRSRVKENSGIQLNWEIKRIGRPAAA